MAENNQVENGGKKKSKLVSILLVIFLVLGAIGGTLAFTNKAAIAKYLSERKKKELQTFALDPFVVNLADGDYRRYLKTSLVLEFYDEKLAEQLAKDSYKIRDSVINILSSKSVEQVKAIEDKEALKKELVKTVNENLGESKIESLYWTEFVIQ